MTYVDDNSTLRPASTWPRMLVVLVIAVAIVGGFWSAGWITSTQSRQATVAPSPIALASAEDRPVQSPQPALTGRWPATDQTASLPPPVSATSPDTASPNPLLASRWPPDEGNPAP